MNTAERREAAVAVLLAEVLRPQSLAQAALAMQRLQEERYRVAVARLVPRRKRPRCDVTLCDGTPFRTALSAAAADVDAEVSCGTAAALLQLIAPFLRQRLAVVRGSHHERAQRPPSHCR